jgi:hypothetical protein
MDLIGPDGDFSNRAYRGMQHHGIRGGNAQLAKVIRELIA